MTDKAFNNIFIGLINLFTVGMGVLSYCSNSAEGVAVMLPVAIVIAIVSITVLCKEFVRNN